MGIKNKDNEIVQIARKNLVQNGVIMAIDNICDWIGRTVQKNKNMFIKWFKILYFCYLDFIFI